jgi:hypothetical protein
MQNIVPEGQASHGQHTWRFAQAAFYGSIAREASLQRLSVPVEWARCRAVRCALLFLQRQMWVVCWETGGLIVFSCRAYTYSLLLQTPRTMWCS